MEKNNKTNSISAVLFFVTAFLFLAYSSIFTQDMKNMPIPDMKNMKHEKVVNADSTIIHKGIIDLKAIDKNKDGKVFQDQMDWNVISDKPGKCPLCGMTLKEVTLKSAKKNLIENGFKAK
jgi:hypothetical protein